MKTQKITVAQYEHKKYLFVVSTLILVVVIIFLFLKSPNILWYEWCLCIAASLLAFSQLLIVAGKADCYIEIDSEFIGIKLVDEAKAQKIKISEIEQIIFLPERQFAIEVNNGSYVFKYRSLKDSEIHLTETTLLNFAETHNIPLKK